jgi:hypothetical protein
VFVDAGARECVCGRGWGVGLAGCFGGGGGVLLLVYACGGGEVRVMLGAAAGGLLCVGAGRDAPPPSRTGPSTRLVLLAFAPS